MKHLIAEYELREADKGPRGWLGWFSWRSLVCSRMWLFPVIFAVIYALDSHTLREAQEWCGEYLLYCFAEDAQEALSDVAYAAEELLDAAEAQRNSAENLVQACCFVLLLRVFFCATGIINGLRAPFSIAQGLGLDSVEVMRLTRRACLLVGRRSGVCMRFPWADYKGAQVKLNCLLLRARKVGRGLLLPLPPLSAAEQSRLQQELDAVFAAPAAAPPTAPPPSAARWKGAKPADLLMKGVHESPRLRSQRRSWLLLWCVLSACFSAGMFFCAGFVPQFTILLAVLIAYLLTRSSVLQSPAAEWRYVFGRTHYKLYPPYGGVCRVPRSLLQEAVAFSRVCLLRLRGDTYALLPCRKHDAAGLPLLSYRLRGFLHYLFIFAWETLLLFVYWDVIQGILH